MKNLLMKMIFSVLLMVFFGWGMINFYSTQMEFAEVIKQKKSTWSLEMNLTPLLAVAFISILLYLFIYKNKRKSVSLSKALLLPPEFEEGDERETQLTAQACRTSYISMWYSFPVLAGFMLLYPFIIDQVPAYPIILLLLLPFIQIISYFISWKKNY